MEYHIAFDDRETLPSLIEKAANELGLTQEQLIKRYITEGIVNHFDVEGPAKSADTLEEFFVKNHVLFPVDKE
ncbi:hypothetical protein [Saccharospirillum alexandrii]|uniref:hypothetical protein n=1 Tax=Saccharospirillum alexandrii TaxID=2448477 RepID=UPI000FD92AB9|nr:hypothetical protein [Saccharospirillum alexandrii]